MQAVAAKVRRPPEQILARLASRSHGVVTRDQLRDAGVTRAEIEHRLRTGALLRVHRGVYRVGHGAPSVLATYLAAVRACGEGAVLSGRAAAHLHGLLRHAAPPEVTAPTERRVAGVRTRRRTPATEDASIWRGIPVTSVPCTLVDLAADMRIGDLARACHEAGVRYGTTPRMVDAVLARRPNSPGAAKLRAILHGDAPATLSRLEARALKLLREERLELPPHVNRPAGGHYVDFRWPAHRLTVELDSYTFHNSRYSWEQDRRREREARARGDEFRRYTWGDVFEDSALMRAELRVLLPRARASRTRPESAGGGPGRSAPGAGHAQLRAHRLRELRLEARDLLAERLHEVPRAGPL